MYKRNYLMDMCGFLPAQQLLQHFCEHRNSGDVSLDQLLVLLAFGATATPAILNRLGPATTQRGYWLTQSSSSSWSRSGAALEYARRHKNCATAIHLLHRISYRKTDCPGAVVYWQPRSCNEMALYGYSRAYRRAVRTLYAAMHRRRRVGRAALPLDLIAHVLRLYCFRMHFFT